MARDRRRSVADGGGHAGFRLRRAAELAAVLPDQGDGCARRAHRDGAGTAGLSRRPERFSTSDRRVKAATNVETLRPNWPFSAAKSPARQSAAKFKVPAEAHIPAKWSPVRRSGYAREVPRQRLRLLD